MKTRLDIILETVSELLEIKKTKGMSRKDRIARLVDKAGGSGSQRGRKILRTIGKDYAREIRQDEAGEQEVERGVDAARAARER